MHTKEITKDSSVTALFWRYAIPSVAAMLVNGLYQLVDGIFVGHYIGPEGLKAINIAWPVISVISGLGLMIGMGAGSLLSIFRGEKRMSEARNAMVTGLLLTIIFGVVGSVYLSLFGTSLVDIQGATGIAHGYALDYVSVFTFGAVVTVASSALPFLIRNDESPIFATLLMVIGALSNIVLDYVFIGLWGWGLHGAALATVCAQLITVLMAVVYLFSRYSQLAIFRHPFHPSVRYAKKSVVLGSSALAMFMYYGVLIGFHNRLFAEYGSSVSVAAFAVVGYLMTIYYVIAEGLAEGIQPQVSFYHGAKQFDHIVTVVKLATFVSLGIGLSWLAMLNLFPEQAIAAFNSDNPALIAEATIGIRLHLSSMYLDGLIIIASMYFLSVGKGGMSLSISIANMIVQFPFLLILPTIWGLNGVWLSMPISNIVLASVVLPIMWRDILKKKNSYKDAMA